MHGMDGGEESADDRFIAEGDVGVGATIMGRNMFGPIRGPWGDEAWKGWWGDDPPYHHPVFVLTHHPHEPITMQGGTTFHFVTDGIDAALERAFDAADGNDVRIGGGAPPSSSTCAPAWSTRCTSPSCRSCSDGASDSSTTSMAAPPATNASSWSARPRWHTSAWPEHGETLSSVQTPPGSASTRSAVWMAAPRAAAENPRVDTES